MFTNSFDQLFGCVPNITFSRGVAEFVGIHDLAKPGNLEIGHLK